MQNKDYFKHGIRRYRFEAELYDKNNNFKKKLKLIDGNISMQAFAEIKQIARIDIIDDDEIDFLNDTIQLNMIIEERTPTITTYKRGGELITPLQTTEHIEEIRGESITEEKFPLGRFVLSSPIKRANHNNIIRTIEAYDRTIYLKYSKVLKPFTINKGELLCNVIVELLNEVNHEYNIDIPKSNYKASRDMHVEIGESYLTVINRLLNTIGYEPIHTDNEGNYKSFPYVEVKEREITHTYIDDELSVIMYGGESELDLLETYNTFLIVRTNEDQKPISVVLENNDPDNPFSIPNLGRRVVDFREVEDAADEEALLKTANRIMEESYSKYGRIRFETAIIPTHSFKDKVFLRHTALNINNSYLEVGWEFPLQVGGSMKHELRQIVNYRERRYV